MVDQGQTTFEYEYKLFRGINKRDDENNLIIGQSPEAQNFDITKQTGLKKKAGFEELFGEFDPCFSFAGATNFTDLSGTKHYVSVSYPEMHLHNRINGFPTTIDTTLASDGVPFFIPFNNGQMLMVDGGNAPTLMASNASGGVTVSKATWPPSYNVQNNSLLDESPDTTAANPTTLGTDIGFPSFGAAYENRAWLAGDKLAPQRIYVSKVLDYDEFGTNSGSTFDVAFFVDVQSESPITALKVVNNQFMVVYCEREILIMSGKFPPASGFPAPYFSFKKLNASVGCLGPRLVTDKGNNDHYFVANNGLIYTLNNTANFQDVKPRGISDKIHPLLQELDLPTLKRGYLVNHQIKGELQFFVPSKSSLRYPDQRFIFNYSELQDDEEWSLDNGFGDFYLRDTFIDDETNKQVLITPTKFLDGNAGLTYDGSPIDMIYQLSTLNFGDSDMRKDIDQIIIYVSNLSATSATITFYHLWENDQAGYKTFTIPASSASTFGEAVFDTSEYEAFAGKRFSKVEFTPHNKQGRILKARIRHTGEQTIFVHSIVFRGKVLGR
jgi:hypothetical protein